VRLDIACGQRTQPGYTGIDLWPHADIVHDLFVYPWPIETGTVEAAYVSHFVEHIPHWRPGWAKDGWWLFWEEVQRILLPRAKIIVIHPFLKTVRAFQDPTHERFIPTETWSYLSAAWRREAGLDHYDTDVDFTMTQIRSRGTSNEFVPDDWDSLMDIEVELQRE